MLGPPSSILPRLLPITMENAAVAAEAEAEETFPRFLHALLLRLLLLLLLLLLQLLLLLLLLRQLQAARWMEKVGVVWVMTGESSALPQPLRGLC